MGDKQKNWTIEVSMNEEDFQAVLLKAGRAGLTAGELASAFFNDLVHGKYTNGSDERMLAEEYFDRCFYTGGPCLTFSQYLLAHDEMEQFIDTYRDRQSEQAEAEDIKADIAEETDEDEKTEMQKTLDEVIASVKELGDDLQALYDRFRQASPHYDGTAQDAIAEAVAWYEGMERTMQEGRT